MWQCAWENAKISAIFCLFPSFLQNFFASCCHFPLFSRKFLSLSVIFVSWEKVPGIPAPRIHLFPSPASQYLNYSLLRLDFGPTKARVENNHCEGGQIQIPPILSLPIKRIPQIKCGLLQSEWRWRCRSKCTMSTVMMIVEMILKTKA